MIKISVIIPFYKGEAFISGCVDSIFSSFQRVKADLNLEVFIIIDSETDISLVKELIAAEILNLPELYVEKNDTNIGVAATRNRGLSLATGDYIYLIDQDDRVAPEFFQKILPLMHSGSDFILCNGMYHFIEKDFRIKIYYLKPSISLKNIALNDIIRSPGQVVVRSEVIKKNKFPVPQRHCGCDDKFCWILIFTSHPFMKLSYVKECVYYAIIHSSNFSNNYKELYECGIEMWSKIPFNQPCSELKSLSKRNENFYKYMTNAKTPSFSEYLRGMKEFMCYHFSPNKALSFIIKKIKTALV